MLNINGVQCPYRDYGELIICYSNIFRQHFILQDVYADFFRYYYVLGKSRSETVGSVCDEYNVSENRVSKDFQNFICQLDRFFIKEKHERISDVQNSNIISDKDIYNYMTHANIPFSATIEITDSCNLNCIHCYRGIPQPSYWNIQTWSDALEKLKALGTLHLTITGGEPFIHPQIARFLEIANDKGFVISIQTNATYGVKEIMPVLQKVSIKTIFVSLYSMSENIHDFITRHSGSMAITKKNIENFVSSGIPVSINCPIMIYNRESMLQIKKFSDSLDIKCNFAFKIIPSQQNDKQTLALNCFSADFLYRCINNKDIKLYENELIDMRKTIPGDRYCQTGFRSITLDAQGNVLICNAFRKICGNIKTQTISVIWNTSQVLCEWRKVNSLINSKCSHCKAYAYCEPCPAHAYTLTGSDKCVDDLTCAFGRALYDADNQRSI